MLGCLSAGVTNAQTTRQELRVRTRRCDMSKDRLRNGVLMGSCWIATKGNCVRTAHSLELYCCNSLESMSIHLPEIGNVYQFSASYWLKSLFRTVKQQSLTADHLMIPLVSQTTHDDSNRRQCGHDFIEGSHDRQTDNFLREEQQSLRPHHHVDKSARNAYKRQTQYNPSKGVFEGLCPRTEFIFLLRSVIRSPQLCLHEAVTLTSPRSTVLPSKLYCFVAFGVETG